MKKPDYVVVSCIQTSPEKVGQAFTDIDVMRHWLRFGGHPRSGD